MILTYIEIRDGKVKKSSLETLSEARRQGRGNGRARRKPSSSVPRLDGAVAGTRAPPERRKSIVLENPELGGLFEPGIRPGAGSARQGDGPGGRVFPGHGDGPRSGPAACGPVGRLPGLRLHGGLRLGRPADRSPVRSTPGKRF